MLDIIGTGTAIGMAAGVAAVAGGAERLVGLGQAAVWTARTIATGFKVGAPGVGLALAGETALDFASLGLNALQCAGGDQGSCLGVGAAAVDVLTGPNVVGDAAGARALGTKTKLPSFGGQPEVVAQESNSTPTTRTTTFWRGTDDESAPRVAKGIDFSEGKPGQDFDPNGQASFYVTKDRTQAERWARERASERRTNPALVRYDVPDEELATLNEKQFSGTTQDWQDFVRQSRSGTGGPVAAQRVHPSGNYSRTA